MPKPAICARWPVEHARAQARSGSACQCYKVEAVAKKYLDIVTTTHGRAAIPDPQRPRPGDRQFPRGGPRARIHGRRRRSDLNTASVPGGAPRSRRTRTIPGCRYRDRGRAQSREGEPCGPAWRCVPPLSAPILPPDDPDPHQVWIMIGSKKWAPRKPPVGLHHTRDRRGAARRRGPPRDRGSSVPIYSAAKSIADCFKHRNKMGMDVAIEALRGCLRERKCTADDLWRYAKVCRVQNVMRPYLQALL